MTPPPGCIGVVEAATRLNGAMYEISLKQGDLWIEVSSDDVYFISRQMDKWCQLLMDDHDTAISILPSSKPLNTAIPLTPPVSRQASSQPPSNQLPEPAVTPLCASAPPVPDSESAGASPMTQPPLQESPTLASQSCSQRVFEQFPVEEAWRGGRSAESEYP